MLAPPLLLLWRELDRLLPLRVSDVTMIAGVHVCRVSDVAYRIVVLLYNATTTVLPVCTLGGVLLRCAKGGANSDYDRSRRME